jgi:hypothetical protein
MINTPGQQLENSIRSDLPPHVELDPREEALLRAAAAQADDIAALEADIAARGCVLEGGAGQPRRPRGPSGATGACTPPQRGLIYRKPRM